LKIMFTGLVEGTARVRSLLPQGSGARLVLAGCPASFAVRRGQSVSVSGACLSVSELLAHQGERLLPDETAGADLAFDLSAETLERTWFRALVPGRALNLERALVLGARLDGHLVAGHVDAVGEIVRCEQSDDGGATLVLDVPAGFERYLVDKGSITIDGVSLTVVAPHGRRFEVALIPLTLQHTTFGSARAAERVNLEADMLGKWVERLLLARGA
jgi:riboflavin synthase